MRKNMLLIILLMLFMVGCASNAISRRPDSTGSAPALLEPTNSPAQTTAAELPTEPQTETATEPATEPPTIATTVPETVPEDLSLDVEPGTYLLRFDDENSGDYLEYYLFVPNNPQKGMPLIVFLHGMGEVGQVDSLKNYGIVSVTKELYGEDFPFLLLLPNTHVKTWIKDAVPYTLKALIDSTVIDYEVDTEHIILTGHSLGAIGTWKMVSLYGDFFSAAVPVSCGIDDELNYENFANIPVWGFVGTDGYYEENYNKAMHKIVAAVNENGGNVVLTVFEGVEHTETVTLPYTQELFDWMLVQ